jgi:hypothetical protein
MTKAQNYLLHIVSQIPSSESPLNALLTRQNVESVNEQTAETIRQVKDNIADLQGRITRYFSPSQLIKGRTYRCKRHWRFQLLLKKDLLHYGRNHNNLPRNISRMPILSD